MRIWPRSRRLFRPAPPRGRAIPKRSSRTWIVRSRPKWPDASEARSHRWRLWASRLSGLAAADRRLRRQSIAVARTGHADLSCHGPIRLRGREDDDIGFGLPLRPGRSRHHRLSIHDKAEESRFRECEVEPAFGVPVRETSDPGDPQPFAGGESLGGFSGRILSRDLQLSIGIAAFDTIDDRPAISIEDPFLSNSHSSRLRRQTIGDRSGADRSKRVALGIIAFMRDEGHGNDL